MKRLLQVLLAFFCGGMSMAQSSDGSQMESIDSLILARHHYDPRVVKVDTAYFHNSKRITEHYFIDTTTNALERAVVQVHHTPTSSTIEYYFFLDNTLARVQSQDYKGEQFSDAEIHYFYNNTPIDCDKKNRRPCDTYMQKARMMVNKLKQHRI
jgi:hypothetical protein